MSEWQPVRIAPASHIARCHAGAASDFWRKHEGRIVLVRRWDPLWTWYEDEYEELVVDCAEAFELHPNFWMDDGTPYPVQCLCEHQILAD